MKKKEAFLREENRKKEALNVSIKEGAASSFSGSIGETYVTPFALALKADSLYVGLLSAISGLVAPLSQVFGDKLMEKHSRKNIVRVFVIAQVLVWICIASLAYFLWKGVSGGTL